MTEITAYARQPAAQQVSSGGTWKRFVKQVVKVGLIFTAGEALADGAAWVVEEGMDWAFPETEPERIE